MGDLISRKMLLKEIDYYYDLGYGETYLDPRDFHDMVELQPTAYDVGEVVGRLKRLQEDGIPTRSAINIVKGAVKA